MSEKTKQSNEPNNNVKPHDRFFKKSMSYPEIAHEFFKSYLPKEILEIIIHLLEIIVDYIILPVLLIHL
jgi:hypothetical protein